MRKHASRLLGFLLLALAVVLLGIAPHEFSVLHMYGFLVCFVWGSLLIIGIFGTEPAAVEARRRRLATPAQPRPAHFVDVGTRIFRYPPVRPAAKVVLVLLAVFNLGLGALVALAFHRQSLLNAIIVPLPLVLLAVGLPWYLGRIPHVEIDVTSDGLRAESVIGVVSIPWDEIVALVYVPVRIPIFAQFDYYKIYSTHDRITFHDKLQGATELRNLLARKTGLSWQ
jgi:hypothetical protein